MESFCGGGDFYECSCDCHKTGAVHIRACCSQCPYCLKNITVFFFEDHKKDCGKNHGYINPIKANFI